MFPPSEEGSFIAPVNPSVGFYPQINVSVELHPGRIVRFVFPRSGHQLFANETFLSAASPYFGQLFSSNFQEGAVTMTDDTVDVLFEDYAFDDSDDETDQLVKVVSPFSSENEPSLQGFKIVKVTDATYSTYFAVLVWLRSGYIDFAPPLSYDLSEHDETVTREHILSVRNEALANRTGKKASPLLPNPVSPKSVFRLAHFLELPTLSALALKTFRRCLTPSSAAIELYSDDATCYPSLRDAVLELAEKGKKV
ncbi:hypothetical protein JCM8547_009079 [Rhodosporidiobolus lusitaniae]